ncbi:MAG: 20S proteasome subunit A/B [Verrucomicrobiia bacterium]|jgi:proteasome alpha subunit
MTEEPYRWLEAISNRREYVTEQLKSGSPVFAASLADGILLLGVGSGQSKVFELHDREAMAALGHPADIEKLRQAAVDAAHVESFTRAAEDVTLRRLVSFNLSARVKQEFEQLFTAPFLTEILFAELGNSRAEDVLVALHFDGGFQFLSDGVGAVAPDGERAAEAQAWLVAHKLSEQPRKEAGMLMLRAWWRLTTERSFGDDIPVEEITAGVQKALEGKTLEIGWLKRDHDRAARYEELAVDSL